MGTRLLEIHIRTKAFSTEPEGDLEYCNGMPGSQVVEWLRSILVAKGYYCGELIQEDFGWVFELDHRGSSIAVSVSYVAPLTPEDAPMIPEWHVIISANWLLRNVLDWFRGRRRLPVEEEVFDIVKLAIESRDDIEVLDSGVDK